MAEATGYAVKSKAGAIDVRTVSPTERAAKVNGLVLGGYFVSNSATDEYIAVIWDDVASETGNQIVPVLIREGPDHG